MCFEPKITYGLIDALAGGVGLEYPQVLGKEFTSIELELMTIVSSVMVDTINQAWFEVFDLQAEIIKTEVNPQFLGIAPSYEPVLSTTFEVELAGAAGTLTLIIPSSLIEPISAKLNSAFEKRRSESLVQKENGLSKKLKEATIEIVAHMNLPEISVAHLRTLKIGDFIQVGTTSKKDIELSINAAVVAKGELVTEVGKYRIQINRDTGKGEIK